MKYLDPKNSKAKVIAGELGGCEEHSASPSAVVIFGASGDLTSRKLIPALYKLFKSGLLNKNFFILGLSRSPMDDALFRDKMKEALIRAGSYEQGYWKKFVKHIYYNKFDYSLDDSYRDAALRAIGLEEHHKTGSNRLLYLATPPSLYETIIKNIGTSKLATTEHGWTRVIIEKPFGYDSASAQILDLLLHRYFREDQIYRIDHYLGKETVQNIMMLRFANSIFEPIWNRQYIDHIQITTAESLGVERRAGYYDSSGVIRDMFQNHMLQLLALATMEPPSTFNSEGVRDERVKVLGAIRPLDLNKLESNLVLGQYGATTLNGEKLPAYLDEPGVSESSTTPTYAALKLHIDNWRWSGVPFYLRSGKRLKRRVSEVAIQFKCVPHQMFQRVMDSEIGANRLVLRLQPDERVQLYFHTKSPGSRFCLRNVLMDFSYSEGYKGLMLEAYERVLLDALIGEDMLFVRSDGVASAWALLTPLLEKIENGGASSVPLHIYPCASWGPQEATGLLAKENDQWISDIEK